MFCSGLTIAGLRIDLRCDLPLEPPAFPVEYHSFVVASGFPGERELAVELVPGLPPDGGRGEMMVNAGPWRLYRKGSGRRIVWQGPEGASPLWVADAGEGVVKVWCGERLVRRDSGYEMIRNPFRYPLDQLVLMFLLSGHGRVIVHSAGLVLGEGCVVAAGRSGAGKSTLSRHWAAAHGGEALLSDDRLIVGRQGGDLGRCEAYGAPWPGELGAARNECKMPVALVFLAKARETSLVPIGAKEATERLLPLTTIPWFDPEHMSNVLSGVERWVAGCPAYELRFTPDESAVKALESLFPGGVMGGPSGGARLPG